MIVLSDLYIARPIFGFLLESLPHIATFIHQLIIARIFILYRIYNM